MFSFFFFNYAGLYAETFTKLIMLNENVFSHVIGECIFFSIK